MKICFKSLLLFLVIVLTACSDMLDEDFDEFPAKKVDPGHHNAAILSIMPVSGTGRLYPEINSDDTDYQIAPVFHDEEYLTLVLLAESEESEIRVNGEFYEQGDDIEIGPLNHGGNPVEVVVIAEDGVTEKEYTINIYRALPVFQTGAGAVDYRDDYEPDDREDAALRYGKPWPELRFEDNGNTVRDNLTGLEWVKDPLEAGEMNWADAVDYCNNLSYNDYSDWVLPNREEMRSLIHYGAGEPAGWLGENGFEEMPEDSGPLRFFTSTTFAKNNGSAWLSVMLSDIDNTGSVDYRDKGAERYIWPVRREAYTMPATGQNQEFKTGDDGSLQRGADWPDPRFFNNGDGTITDNLTGLIWLQKADGDNEKKQWSDALDYIESLNNNSEAGYNDWRLPNINELATLFNSGKYNQADWLISKGFESVENDEYWSSTVNASDPECSAWFLDFEDGRVNFELKASGYYSYKYVWPVRGGIASENGN